MTIHDGRKAVRCIHCDKPLGDAPTNIEPWAHGPCATEARLQLLGQRYINALYRYYLVLDGRTPLRNGTWGRAIIERSRAEAAYVKFRDALPRNRVVPVIFVPRPRKRRR